MKLFSRIRDKLLSPGFHLSKYVIISTLGMGSYGVTYHAKNVSTGQDVVIKQLRKRKHTQSGLRAFDSEILMLKELSHPSLPNFIKSFSYHKQYYLVMTKISGKSIEELLFEEEYEFSKFECFEMISKIICILKSIHDCEIVHRDLRPPNIMIDGKNVGIIDLGLARHLSEKKSNNRSDHSLMREIHPRSDFYALGHTLLFLLYSNYEATDKKKKSWEEIRLSEYEKGFIRRLLQIDPPFDSASEVLQSIQNILDRTRNSAS